MSFEPLFREIDKLSQKYLNIFEDVVNIESPTDLKVGVDKVGNYFIQMAKEQGFSIEVLKQEKAGNAILISMNDNSQKEPVASAILEAAYKIID